MGIGIREKLAQAIHEKYRKNQEGKKPADDSAMQPWENLTEDLKESNRQQADQIPEKLKAVGYGLHPAASKEPANRGFTQKEVEILAMMEHARWLKDKIAAGWTYAPLPRNDAKKTHPSLVSWEKLPPTRTRSSGSGTCLSAWKGWGACAWPWGTPKRP